MQHSRSILPLNIQFFPDIRSFWVAEAPPASQREGRLPSSEMTTIARQGFVALPPAQAAMRMFGGRRDGGYVHMPTLLQSSRPCALRIALLVNDAQVCPCAVHKERSQVARSDGSRCP